MAAWSSCAEGAPDGPAELERALVVFKSTGSRCFLPYWHSFQADALSARGAHDEALALLAGAHAAIEASQERWAEPEVHRLHGQVLARSGADPREVQAAYERAIATARARGMRAWEAARRALARSLSTRSQCRRCSPPALHPPDSTHDEQRSCTMTTTKSLNRDLPFPDLPIDAFLYGHEGPWPQPSRDHPFGQAPEIYNIPQEEWADWKKYVGSYYLDKIAEFGLEAGVRSLESAFGNAQDYAPITDAEFTTLLCEGLYSKFLSPLDPRDQRTFKDYITSSGDYEYWKSDYSCMRVVRQPWAGEAVAASIALLRRPRNDPGFKYEVLALMLQVWDAQRQQFIDSEIFTPADGEAWRVARYFVLQGAIHRINLIDHTEVHFPADAINAITKTVLPKANLVLRLLQPHLWLSLPVNNTVLEGQRSLINRDTWYPWSPFVAKGDEVRRLLPFGWYGSAYYAAKDAIDEPYRDPYFDEPNSSYPAFTYDPIPPEIPSRYGEFLNAYFAPVRKFVRGVVEQMNDADWREIGYWAQHISTWLPGFPTREDLTGADGQTRDKELLADTLAHFIWNASVRHSADHQTLHEMMVGRTRREREDRRQGAAGAVHPAREGRR